MIVFLLAGMMAVATPDRSPPALPPPDWSTLPILALRRPAPSTIDTSAFVRDEVVHGRCAAAVQGRTGWMLTVDLAVLATADGRLRRVVPRAIGCPGVEQYAAGLVSSSARDNLETLPGDSDRWYRTRLTFVWAS